MLVVFLIPKINDENPRCWRGVPYAICAFVSAAKEHPPPPGGVRGTCDGSERLSVRLSGRRDIGEQALAVFETLEAMEGKTEGLVSLLLCLSVSPRHWRCSRPWRRWRGRRSAWRVSSSVCMYVSWRRCLASPPPSPPLGPKSCFRGVAVSLNPEKTPKS
jgi:hypothetical protein